MRQEVAGMRRMVVVADGRLDVRGGAGKWGCWWMHELTDGAAGTSSERRALAREQKQGAEEKLWPTRKPP